MPMSLFDKVVVLQSKTANAADVLSCAFRKIFRTAFNKAAPVNMKL